MSKSCKNHFLYVSDVKTPDIKIIQYGYITKDDWFFPGMNSPFWYLWRNRDRCCSVISDGITYFLEPEYYYLLPPFTSFSASSGHRSMTQFHVHFTFSKFAFELKRKPIAIPVNLVNHLSEDDFFQQFEDNRRKPEMLDLWVYSLVCAVLSCIPAEAMIASEEVLVRRYTRLYIDYVNTHYQDLQPYRNFCRQQNISSATLLRSLKRDIHMTPKHYLIYYRLIQAKKLLTETEQTLDEIAVMTGFSDRYHLSKMFKTYCNDSPAGFRKLRSVFRYNRKLEVESP